ncbi:MAG: signal peptidase I [bacterium]
MRKFGKILFGALPYLFFLFAVVLIGNVVISLKNAETPSFFGYSIMHVKSASMEDTIMTGDIIFIRKIDPDELSENDIITFAIAIEQDGTVYQTTVTHRILTASGAAGDRVFTTKGDNNNAPDDWTVPASAVIGRYVGKSAFLGAIFQAIMAGGTNLIYLVVVALFLFIAVVEAATIIKEVSIHRKKTLLEEKEKLIETELARLRAERDGLQDESNEPGRE